MKKLSAILTTTILLIAPAAFGQTPAAPPPPINVLAQSSEYRFQLDFHVNDAALAKMLPAGWISGAATQGPAKDANMRLIFIDAGNIVGPDNKPLGKGTDLMAILAAPVKQSEGGAVGQMILGGLTQNDPQAAFGVLSQASGAKVTRTIATANGATMVTEDWDLSGAGGAHAALHVKYTRLPANKGAGSANFYNPADPKAVQIFRTEQVTDITRNATTNPPDRVAEFTYKASGGKFAALFDGSEKALSWDSQPVYSRIVGTPVP
ncbi:MAG TPA: hypothetical protein VNW15_00910 [Rhizomicrobium sp.]|jgi:hypothetical protein|nr:hypothetical protein [Rhizomicrobium sp.]